MVKNDFSDIVGLDMIISNLRQKGIELTTEDIIIAGVIFSLYDKTAITSRDDKDGLSMDNLEGFIYNEKIDSLIKSFPNAAKLLSSLDRKWNFGFRESDGNIYRTGVMGSRDPITEVKELAEAYTNNGYIKLDMGRGDTKDKKMLYSSKEEYEKSKKGLSDMFTSSGEINYNHNYNTNKYR